MKYFFATSLFACCVLSFYLAVQFFWSKKKKYIENYFAAAFCFSSGIWSLGFSALILQTDPERAYFCRSFGMIGTFLYIIFAQILVCYVSGMKKFWRYLFDGISFTGIIVYFLVIQRSETVYYLSDMGMTYYFKQGFCNNVYMAYTVILAIDILIVTFYMLRVSKIKRIQAFGKKFLLVEFLIAVGTILDTLFPLIGKSAIPGSSMTQFLGMAVLYHAVGEINKSKVNVSNMSEFIYYSLSVPVLVYDADKRIQIMNDAASSFLGISQEAIGFSNISISKLFAIDEEEAFVFNEKRKDVDAVCQKNQVYCSLTVNKIHDVYEDVIGYIIIVTDLSERIRTVQKLEKAIEEAEMANKSKSIFLANMSHEIRTPMNAIIGFSELTLKMDLEPQVREYVEDIKVSSKNLLAIINDILDVSKIESGKMELVCGDYYAANLFNDVFLIIQGQAKKKGLEFQMTVTPDIPNKLYGDKIRIRSVLINLLNNAVKYTKQGTVSLDVNVLKKEEDRVTLEFKVTDTGIGIKQEEQDRLFESFSQVDIRVHYGEEGTGLGLAIAKGYITLMGGEITVQSVYGEGSVFTVVIEQKIVETELMDKSYVKENEVQDEFSIGKIRVSGVRVLVVDDNRINLAVAGSSLEFYGFMVDTASSGKEAIERCRQNRYQMVFMDQMMPEMDGVEAMKQIRKLDSYYDFGGECKIIVLTANAVSGVRGQLMQEGFDEYLGKPINFKQLERLISRFLPKENIQIESVPDEEQTVVKQEESVQQAEKKNLPPSVRTTADAEQQELAEMLPQVNTAQGILNCGGQLKNYFNILQVVYREGEKQLEELRNLQEQQDYTNYTIKIHALKGTALNIGAGQIAEMARAQEKAGKEGNTSYIDAHMEEVQQEYRHLLKQIQAVLAHYQMLEDNTADEKEGAAKEVDILQILKDIRQHVEEFDFAGASKLIREVKREQIPEQYQEVFAQITQWMDEMEIEKIQELIEKYAGQ